MIALSPVWWSWQKTTCSWSGRSAAEPFSLWGIANTLVTVATLLIPSRLLVEPGSESSVLPARGRGRARTGERGEARCVPYWPVTDSRDDLVTLTTAFVAFWYVTIRQ